LLLRDDELGLIGHSRRVVSDFTFGAIRNRNAVLLGILWSVCVIGALSYDVAYWLAAW